MAELLKDQFFQHDFFDRLGDQIRKEYPAFDRSTFIKNVFSKEWEGLSLTQRMAHAARVLHESLPADYVQALKILKKVCVHFDGFDGLIFPDVVRQFGLSHPKESLDALELFTRYGSAEFAIRAFILEDESQTMARMVKWSKHKNHHVRRLSSEGCRPRLPWAMALPKFKKDPAPIIPILENLKDDPELYVRKSVANNLNDLAKDNPEIVLNLLENWSKDATENTQWIIKQGLRTLVKDGNQHALKILGFDGSDVSLKGFNGIPKQLNFGDAIEFQFTLTNKGKTETHLMVDYVVHFQKNNGSLAPKVFKLKSVSLAAKETMMLSKKHRFEEITTRKYHPGEHRIGIQVNGKILGEKSFQLIMD